MAPTIILRDDPPGISPSTAASNQTGQLQEGNPTVGESDAGLVALLTVFACIILMLLASCL
jgi:hypothetical protein